MDSGDAERRLGQTGGRSASGAPITPPTVRPRLRILWMRLPARILASGGKLWVRVRAVGGNDDAGPYSDPATKIVP